MDLRNFRHKEFHPEDKDAQAFKQRELHPDNKEARKLIENDKNPKEYAKFESKELCLER